MPATNLTFPLSSDPAQPPPPLQLEKEKEVCARLRISRSHLRELVAAGAFPKPLRLGMVAVAWNTAEVDTWVKQRMAERGHVTHPTQGRKRGKAGAA